MFDAGEEPIPYAVISPCTRVELNAAYNLIHHHEYDLKGLFPDGMRQNVMDPEPFADVC
jgi:hypothetical protein